MACGVSCCPKGRGRIKATLCRFWALHFMFQKHSNVLLTCNRDILTKAIVTAHPVGLLWDDNFVFLSCTLSQEHTSFHGDTTHHQYFLLVLLYHVSQHVWRGKKVEVWFVFTKWNYILQLLRQPETSKTQILHSAALMHYNAKPYE